MFFKENKEESCVFKGNKEGKVWCSKTKLIFLEIVTYRARAKSLLRSSLKIYVHHLLKKKRRGDC